MDVLDPSTIDQSSHLGQITMLIAVVGIFLSAVSPLFPKNGKHKSRVSLIRERLEVERENAIIVRKINKNLEDWQVVARTLIRVLTNELIEYGGEEDEQIKNLKARLEDIDNREVDYGSDESI